MDNLEPWVSHLLELGGTLAISGLATYAALRENLIRAIERAESAHQRINDHLQGHAK